MKQGEIKIMVYQKHYSLHFKNALERIKNIIY